MNRGGPEGKLPPEEQLRRAVRLQEIAAEHGGDIYHVQPAWLLAEARNPQSIFHDDFTWDDGKAAERYRLLQARKIIRATVVIVNLKQRRINVDAIAYVRDPNKPASAPGYALVSYVKRHPNEAAAALRQQAALVAGHVGRLLKLAEELNGAAEQDFEPVLAAARTLLAEIEAVDQVGV